MLVIIYAFKFVCLCVLLSAECLCILMTFICNSNDTSEAGRVVGGRKTNTGGANERKERRRHKVLMSHVASTVSSLKVLLLGPKFGLMKRDDDVTKDALNMLFEPMGW